ncbi:TPR domain-containing glycosyltransferase [Rossellomorea vietnamensis]|uniref:Glycosyltransferase 2-like domain-containing protein n=1 Tax=Rossellomorea vietnamensis TaxID=218284 RepID=A0A0P6VXR2_9BACI|nr:TPR domain-containing glycosyltransferase [Rossellomorea vietnamensis]KPL57696.1 hypothetical protein AM506_20845 [Rossellomorea vietnamensis]
MLVGLHMIVKNEADNLPQCLSSIKPFVDEMIIVDTGSSDRTKEIAASYGAKVIEAPWENDFSKARNISLEHAKTDWILYLDADEVLHGESKQFRQFLSSSNMEAYRILIESYTGSLPHQKVQHSSIRMFRARKEYEFTGPIHEDIIPSINSFTSSNTDLIGDFPVLIRHYGYQAGHPKTNEKLLRNLEILQTFLAGNQDHPYYTYHLGLTYAQLGNFNQAVALIQDALNRTDLNISSRPTIVKDLSIILISCGLISEAKSLLEDELTNYPEYCDLHYYLGISYVHQKEEDKAIKAFQEAVSKSPSSKYVHEDGNGTFRAWTYMGDIAVKWGAYSDALQFYINALKYCPYYYEALLGFADVLTASNISESNIKKEMTHLLSPTLQRTDQAVIQQLCTIQVANVLFESGCYLEFLEMADQITTPQTSTQERIIISHLHLSNFDLAYAGFENLINQGEVSEPLLILVSSALLKYEIQIQDRLFNYIQDHSSGVYLGKLLKSLTDTQKIQTAESDLDFLLFVKKFLHESIILNAENVVKSITSHYPGLTLFAAKMKYYEGFTHNAYKELKQLKNENAIDTEGLSLLGEYVYDQKRFDEAALIFEEVLITKPDDVRAHVGASLCYNQQARTLLEESSAAMPEYPLFNAYLNKVNLAIELSSKYSWHSCWKGRQRRNRVNEEQHFPVHDCQE